MSEGASPPSERASPPGERASPPSERAPAVKTTGLSNGKIAFTALAGALVLGAVTFGFSLFLTQGSLFRLHVRPGALDVGTRSIDLATALRTAAISLGGGAVFGGLIAALQLRARRREEERPLPLEPGEAVIRDAPCNYGKSGWGGWLYLTDRRLFVRSSSASVRNDALSYPVARIASIEPHLFLGKIVTRAFVVRLEGGDEQRFRVEDCAGWIVAVDAARGRATGASA